MKKLLFILALVPILGISQIPAPLVDLSEYHDDSRIKEMTDWNFTNITEGGYMLPLLYADSIHAGGVLIDNYLTVDSPTFVIDPVNNRVGIGTTTPEAILHISGGGVATTAEIHSTLNTGIAAWQIINDAGRRGSLGVAGSANAFVTPNSLALYQQGYGPTYFIVDGNEDFIWSTDVTDGHALAYTEKMRLLANGGLLTDSISTDAIYYADTYWDDLRFVPGAFSFPGNADPALVAWQPGGSGPTFRIYKFDKDDEGFGSNQMSHSYVEDSDLHFHLHWTPADRGNEEGAAAVVGWKVDYTLASIGDVFTSGTAVLTDTCQGTDDLHQVTSGVVVSGTGLMISHVAYIRIYRSDTGADDTWSGTGTQAPGFLEFDIHFEKSTPGSELEFSKY